MIAFGGTNGARGTFICSSPLPHFLRSALDSTAAKVLHTSPRCASRMQRTKRFVLVTTAKSVMVRRIAEQVNLEGTMNETRGGFGRGLIKVLISLLLGAGVGFLT